MLRNIKSYSRSDTGGGWWHWRGVWAPDIDWGPHPRGLDRVAVCGGSTGSQGDDDHDSHDSEYHDDSIQEYLSSAKVGNSIYLSGGESVYLPEMQDYEDRHSILVWEPDEDEEDEVVGVWAEAGKLRVARNFHGMAAVPEEFVKKFCDIPDWEHIFDKQ